MAIAVLDFLFYFLLVPLIRTIPRKRWRLFVGEEITGFFSAKEIVLLHFHELGLISFLKLEAIHGRRGRRWRRRAVVEIERSWSWWRRHYEIVMMVLKTNPSSWRRNRRIRTVTIIVINFFVQDSTRIAVRRSIVFEILEHWNHLHCNSSSSIVVVQVRFFRVWSRKRYMVMKMMIMRQVCFHQFLIGLIWVRDQFLFDWWEIALCVFFMEFRFQFSNLQIN